MNQRNATLANTAAKVVASTGILAVAVGLYWQAPQSSLAKAKLNIGGLQPWSEGSTPTDFLPTGATTPQLGESRQGHFWSQGSAKTSPYRQETVQGSPLEQMEAFRAEQLKRGHRVDVLQQREHQVIVRSHLSNGQVQTLIALDRGDGHSQVLHLDDTASHKGTSQGKDAQLGENKRPSDIPAPPWSQLDFYNESSSPHRQMFLYQSEGGIEALSDFYKSEMQRQDWFFLKEVDEDEQGLHYRFLAFQKKNRRCYLQFHLNSEEKTHLQSQQNPQNNHKHGAEHRSGLSSSVRTTLFHEIINS